MKVDPQSSYYLLPDGKWYFGYWVMDEFISYTYGYDTRQDCKAVAFSLAYGAKVL